MTGQPKKHKFVKKFQNGVWKVRCYTKYHKTRKRNDVGEFHTSIWKKQKGPREGICPCCGSSVKK